MSTSTFEPRRSCPETFLRKPRGTKSSNRYLESALLPPSRIYEEREIGKRRAFLGSSFYVWAAQKTGSRSVRWGQHEMASRPPPLSRHCRGEKNGHEIRNIWILYVFKHASLMQHVCVELHNLLNLRYLHAKQLIPTYNRAEGAAPPL